jgi:hypothetical protein
MPANIYADMGEVADLSGGHRPLQRILAEQDRVRAMFREKDIDALIIERLDTGKAGPRDAGR